MSNPYDSLFETSSGLPLDGATVTIREAHWGFADFAGGKPVFAVTYVIEETAAEQEQSYTFGNKGVPSGDGRRLVEPPGKLPSSSNLGRLFDSLVQAFQAAGVTSPGAELGDPYLADSWEGTRWVLKGDERETEAPEGGGERKKRTLFIFDQYLGRVGAQGVGPRVIGGSQPAAAGATAAAPATTAAGADEELFGKLVDFAKGYQSHEDFVEAVFDQFPEADQDPATRKLIIITKPGSVWAAAHE